MTISRQPKSDENNLETTSQEEETASRKHKVYQHVVK